MSTKFKQGLLESMLLIPTMGLYYIILDKVIVSNCAEGKSMEPTLSTRSVVFVDKFFYRYRGIKKNDIIIAKSPVKSDLDICKRVLKLENEEEINSGIIIPEDYVWIEGDNKNHSFDSRDHGPLPIDYIKGRVIFSLFPFRFYW